VSRLIDPELAAAWQTDEGQASPSLVVKRPLDCDSAGFEFSYGAIDVIAEEIDLLAWLSGLSWMDGELTGREREDQPTASRVYRVKAENVLEESPICIDVAAENDGVGAADHGWIIPRFSGQT
jgi:hypothetical protein